MRRVLTDCARTRTHAVQAEVSLSDDVDVPGQAGASIVSAVALNPALDHLAAEDAKAVEGSSEARLLPGTIRT